MMSVLTLVSGKEDRTLRRIRVSEIARNPNQRGNTLIRRQSRSWQRVSGSMAYSIR